jgi:asparagine synthase (glutamine-hydrolysing)
MVATDKRIQLSRYWDFDYPRATDHVPERSDAEYAEEFRYVFEESVRMRLRADVPVGCYLSGGIDSCAIVGLAARHHTQAIRAFTLRFDRPEYDEGEVAKEMAARAGAEFYPIPVRLDDLADNFCDATTQSEVLCVNAHGVAKYLLSRGVRDAGYKVVLTGEGSDEIMGGYLHFGRDMMLSNQLSPTPFASLPANGTGPLEGVKRVLGFVPSWIQTAGAQSAKVRGIFADSFLQEFKEREASRSLLNDIDVAGQLTGRHPLNQSLYLWSKTVLPNYLLTNLGDRMEMAHSIEGRVPFLDHRLVELIRSQPVTQKIHGSTQKYVLREAVRDVVTDTVYRRPKHVFQSPPATLDPNGKFNTLVQDVLRGPILRSIPLFDQQKVVTLLDSLHAGQEGLRVANDHVLLIALSACVLQQRFKLSA